MRLIPAGQAIDEFFATQCQQIDPVVAARPATYLLQALDPDGKDGFDPDAHERRELTHSTNSNGMIYGRFQLDPVTGAWFTAAITHFSAPNPTRIETTPTAPAPPSATPAAPPSAAQTPSA